jgi:hypothetical protein
MPFSVFPKFRATSAALSSKIDAVIREIAALLNGGLGAANVKAGTAFPLASFAEQKGAFALRLVSLYNIGANIRHELGVTPGAGRIIGWSAHVYATGVTEIEVWSATRALKLGVIPLSGHADGTRRGTQMLDAPIAVNADEHLYLYVPLSVWAGVATVFFDADHQG